MRFLRTVFLTQFLGGVLCLLASTVPSSSAGVETNAIREWSIGETIDADIRTPVPLAVFNPEQTEALRQAESQRVSPVFRHDASMATTAEAELRTRFGKAREEFLLLIKAAFQEPVLRAVASLSDPRFSEAVFVFRSKDPEFPLSTNLAELWALGDAGGVVLEDLTGKLQRFMTAYLRSDRFPEGEKLTAPTIRIVPLQASTNGPGRGNAAGLRGTNVPRATIYTVSRYRRELANLSPEDEKSLVSFVAGFIRPNCFFDEVATSQARDRRVQDINAVDRYNAGEILARRGETVDGRTKLALDALRTHQEVQAANGDAARLREDLVRVQEQAGRLKTAAETEQRKSVAIVAAIQREVASVWRRNRILRWGLIGASVGCVIFAGLWWRHRMRQRRLEQNADWSLAPTSGAADEAGWWRQRAISAEARAAKATVMLRTNLLPHMARWMMSELVQRLVSQRSEAYGSQARAELEVAQLASRLEKLQAPLEERMRAYERRIVELEMELAAKDEQS
ncbi:MAG TPA: hypothetical protein VJS65_08790, partial [Verrucomicrobiae bacterium]|nr:hypothetical protein [Verrucomicrobiae bacterium]